MNPGASTTISQKVTAAPWTWLALAAVLSASGATAAWMLKSHGGSGPTAALTKTQPDPKFTRPAAPTLSVPLSPEGQRVMADLLNACRCQHTGSQRSLPDGMPHTRLSSAGPDAQAEVLREALGVLPDGCYANTVLPRVVNPQTPDSMMRVLFEDLMKRPDNVKLRTLFLVAGIDSHPMATQALDDLRSALGFDYQQDWSRWESALDERFIRAQHGVRGVSCRVH